MNAEILIEMLEKIKDKKLPIRLAVPKEGGIDYPNYWLHSILAKQYVCKRR